MHLRAPDQRACKEATVAAVEIIDFRFRAQLRSRFASSLPVSCQAEERFPTSAVTNSTNQSCHNRGGVHGVAGLSRFVSIGTRP
jgi:hypothetical protein